MNWDQIEGNWKQFQGSMKQQWGKLTDDDLSVIAGNRDKFVGKVQERYGIMKEEAQKRVDDWAKTLRQEESERAAQKNMQGNQPPGKTFTGKP